MHAGAPLRIAAGMATPKIALKELSVALSSKTSASGMVRLLRGRVLIAAFVSIHLERRIYKLAEYNSGTELEWAQNK